MTTKRAILTVTAGPNTGDSVSLEIGTCRLIGRHLSENETVMMGRDGNRLLDGHASQLLGDHLQDRAPQASLAASPNVSVDAFERGPDIIFSDDSISRAHAMVFYDRNGLGVIDLASTNGTKLNNNRVGSAMLEQGDEISVGSSRLSLSYG